jgi:hypothetical protein
MPFSTGAAAFVDARAASLAFPPLPWDAATVRRRRAVSERRVAFATRACLCAHARAGHGARKRAPQHACAAAVRARPGLGPLFRAPP